MAEKEISKRSSKVHDRAFKRFFAQRELAIDFLNNSIDRRILDHIDLSNMEKMDGSFISRSLKEKFSDLVFSADILGREGK